MLCFSVDSRLVEKRVHVNEWGDISRDNKRQVFGSQEIINYYFQNLGESVDGDGRGGYMSQTRHSTSHNPCGSGILFFLSVAYHTVHKSVHGDDRGDHSCDDRRGGFRSQETRQPSFHNNVESFDADGRGEYKSQASHSTSHNPGGIGI